MHANREIQQFRNLVEDFCDKAEKLCLFEGTSDIARNIFIETILESMIDPILKGRKPLMLSESMYRDMRRDMYKTLINRYIDKVGKNTDNE
jgi:hypothetical protein